MAWLLKCIYSFIFAFTEVALEVMFYDHVLWYVHTHFRLFVIVSREAARECRRKKKEYVKCLENRVAVLENQNKTLIEELKALKDLYCRKTE